MLMNNKYFYGATIGIASGIFTRSLFLFNLAELLFVLLIGMTLFALAFLKKSGKLTFVSTVLIAIALGALRFEASDVLIQDDRVAPFHGREVALEGVVVREPDRRESQTLLSVRVEKINESEVDTLVQVSAERLAPIHYGDRLRVVGTLKEPESFEGEGGRMFDYIGYLKARGITHTMSFADIEVVAEGEGNALFATLYAIKSRFVSALRSVLPEPSSGFAEGLLLGAKRAIGSDLESIFRTVGIIHIVVLSGYNITLVADFVMRLFGYVFSLRARIIAAICAIVLFAIFVGLSATVVRASVMASLALIARSIGRTYAIMRALILAGIVMLLINPYLLVFDPGFQLSFLATLGLIVLSPKVAQTILFVTPKFNLRDYASATIATQIMVLPLLLYSIGNFSVFALPANLLILPLIPVAMLLSFITGLLGLLHPFIALPVGYAAHAVLFTIIFIAKMFAAIPFADFTLPAFPFWVVIVPYALLAFALMYKPFSKLQEMRVQKEKPPVIILREITDDFPFR